MIDLFTPAFDAWASRPPDPNDVWFAERVAKGPAKARFALFGIPFDGAVIGRKGARDGPAVIRAELAKLKPWSMTYGPGEFEAADWGDVAFPADAPTAAVHERVEAAARAVLDAGAVPVALGGDHSLTFPLVKAHGARRLGVINLDAHLDVREVHKGVLNSGQSFGRLLDEGLVNGANLVEVGIRDFANSPHYADKVRRAGGTIFTGRDVSDRGAVPVIEHAVDLAAAGTDGIYLSVDVDVLDQSHGPGVSAPTPGGLTTREFFDAVRTVAMRAKVVAADFVEVAPSLDRDGMTSRAAAFAILHLLSGAAAGRR